MRHEARRRVLHVGENCDGGDTLDAVASQRVGSLSAALTAHGDGDFDAIVVEASLPGAASGLDVVEELRSLDGETPIVFWTAEPDGVLASEATRVGATDYIAGSGPESLAERLDDILRSAWTTPAGESHEESAFHTISDTVADLVVTVDEDSTIVYANDSAQAVTGYDRETLVGGPLTRIMPERFEAAHQEGLASYLKSGERTLDWEYIELAIEHADGHEIPVSVSFGEFTQDGEHFFTGIIRDITEREQREAELRESQSALQQLYEITSRSDQRFEEKLDDLLALGCERLDLRYGYLTRVEDEEIEMEQSRGLDAFEGQSTSIEYAYCRETVDAEGLVTIQDTTEGKWADSKPTEAFGMRCYVGGRILVDGDLYGTLCFADREPHEAAFTEAQESFVELMVQWLAYELERRQRETMLTSLLETTRALMQAPTADAIAQEVVDAAKEVLGFEWNIVRLVDPEDGALHPTAMTEETVSLLGERPVYQPGEGVPGSVYASGDPETYTITAEDADGQVVEPDILCLPIGTYGTLTVSSRAQDDFDRTDEQVARILAANAEAALARAERTEALARYKTVMETVQHMVFVVDENGRCTLATGPLADRLGYEEEAIDGMAATALVASDSVQRLSLLLEGILDGTRSTTTVDVTAECADGSTFPAQIDLSALPGQRFRGAVGVVYDRSELAQTRAELETERDRFTDLFENIPDAVVDVEIADGEPEITATNPAFEDVFGWEESTVVGDSLTKRIVPPDDRETGLSLAERAANGEVIQEEVQRRTADGARYFLFRGVPYEVGGDRTRAFGIYTDITEQRSRQRQLQVLNRVFRHNLRNDLTVMLGITNHLGDILTDPELSSFVDTLRSKAEGLSEMSETVRVIEQTVSHGTTADTIDAADVLRGTAEDYRKQYPEATISVAGPESLVVTGDDHLRIALDQLLENAIKHVEETPRVECALRTDEAGDWATISVLDNGPGIPEHERVVAEDREIDQLNHASGLGLWLVRWIVDSYGGHLSFSDRPDGGSQVSISLPIPDEA